MQIETAIETAREASKRMEEQSRAHEFMFEFAIAHKYRMRSAAVRIVCDALEGFLAKQEEDNSYHTK